MIMELLTNTEELSFTGSDNAIKDYIIANPEAVLECSIKELAAKAFVGVASINRFCKKIGFEGYADFRNNYILELEGVLNNRFLQVDKPYNESTTLSEIIYSIPLIYSKAIGYTQALINQHILNRAIEYMKDSHIILYGNGLNKSLAETFCYKLEGIGHDCSVFDSLHYRSIIARLERKEKMYGIILTHSGRNATMLKVMGFLNKYAIPYVVISGYSTEELQKLTSNIMNIIPVNKTNELSEIQFMISSQYILDILYSALLAKNIKFVDQIVDKTNSNKKEQL